MFTQWIYVYFLTHPHSRTHTGTIWVNAIYIPMLPSSHSYLPQSAQLISITVVLFLYSWGNITLDFPILILSIFMIEFPTLLCINWGHTWVIREIRMNRIKVYNVVSAFLLFVWFFCLIVSLKMQSCSLQSAAARRVASVWLSLCAGVLSQRGLREQLTQSSVTVTHLTLEEL